MAMHKCIRYNFGGPFHATKTLRNLDSHQTRLNSKYKTWIQKKGRQIDEKHIKVVLHEYWLGLQITMRLFYNSIKYKLSIESIKF